MHCRMPADLVLIHQFNLTQIVHVLLILRRLSRPLPYSTSWTCSNATSRVETVAGVVLYQIRMLLLINCPWCTGCGINVVNSCSYPVTTCAESGSAGTYQYQLAAGGSQYLDFGSACKWPSGVVYASITGNCANPDRPLANLAEFTIGPSDSAQDTYDLSNVVSIKNFDLRSSLH